MRKKPKKTELQFEREAEKLRELIQKHVSPFPDEKPGEQEKRILRARKDKAYFLRTYFPHYFYSDFARFHEEWLKLSDVTDQLVLVAAPREHAKSTIFTFGVPLHAICHGLRRFILIISDTEDQAAGFTLPIRMELEENPRIRHDFGDLTSWPWKDNDFVTSSEVRVKARGRGQKLRGLKFKQFRPDLAIVDDFENDENVKNPKRVKAGLDWLLTAVLGSLASGFSMVMVGNIFAPRSVLSRLMNEKDEDGEPLYLSRIYEAHDKDGNPLWPEAWTKKRLEARRRQMGTVRFNREMMNRVIDEENPIKPEWFTFHVEIPKEVRARLIVASFLDPSAKFGMTNDFKAIITVGLDPVESVFYVLHAWIRRASINEMLDAALRIYKEFRGRFGIEVNMLEDFLTKAFEDYQRAKNTWLPLVQVRQTSDKIGRILGTVAPLLEFERLSFKRGHSDQDLLIEQIQYITDPNVNDDGPDALQGAISLLEGGGPNIW